MQRGNLARKQTESQNDAAIKLQAVQRGNSVRKDNETKEIPAPKKVAEKKNPVVIPPIIKPPDTEEDNAATKLQAVQRGNLARKQTESQNDAATKLQAVQRGKTARAQEPARAAKREIDNKRKQEEQQQQEEYQTMVKEMKIQEKKDQVRASERLYSTKKRGEEKREKMNMSKLLSMKMKVKKKIVSRRKQALRDRQRAEQAKLQVEKRKKMAEKGYQDPEATFTPKLEAKVGNDDEEYMDEEEKRLAREKRFERLHGDGKKKLKRQKEKEEKELAKLSFQPILIAKKPGDYNVESNENPHDRLFRRGEKLKAQKIEAIKPIRNE